MDPHAPTHRVTFGQVVTEKLQQGWIIESQTDTSVVLRRKKLNNPAWFIASLVTAPFIFGLGFVVWAVKASTERSRRLVIWVDGERIDDEQGEVHVS